MHDESFPITETEVFVDEHPPIILDRSTVERGGVTCPLQGWMVDHQLVSNSSELTDMGNECHRIIAEAVKMRQQDAAQAAELRDHIILEAMSSRPDTQPHVVAAFRRGVYPLVRMLCSHPDGRERHPDDLLCYDGGEGDYSGQLAADIMPATGERGPIRLTGEVDLLTSTASPEEVELTDWKSGWKHWTASDVITSFQFQWYAWLIFYRYPAVNRVRVRVMNVREGSFTSPVDFLRDDEEVIRKRLISAVNNYLEHADKVRAEDVEAWPAPDKCSLCPAATKCTLAHAPAFEIAVNPGLYLKQYAATQNAADAMAANLSKYVRERGNDLECDGIAYGGNKPKATRAVKLDLYEVPNETKAPPIPSLDRQPPAVEPVNPQPAPAPMSIPPVDKAADVPETEMPSIAKSLKQKAAKRANVEPAFDETGPEGATILDKVEPVPWREWDAMVDAIESLAASRGVNDKLMVVKAVGKSLVGLKKVGASEAVTIEERKAIYETALEGRGFYAFMTPAKQGGK